MFVIHFRSRLYSYQGRGRRPEDRGRKKEEREKGDARILGGGDFVGKILDDSGQIEGYKFLRKVSLPELVVKVSTYLDADKDEALSGNRRLKNCHVRDLISFVAAKSIK